MDEKKLKILEKAKELFLIYGVKKTTVDEIAKSAGIGKGTVYLYFSSKGDIVSDLAVQEANNIASQLNKVIAKENSPEEKLRVFIKSFILNCHDFVNSNVHAADIFDVMRHYRSKCEIGTQSYEGEMAEITKIASEILLAGKEENTFIFDDLLELIGNISFTLQSYFPPISTELERDYLDKKSDYIIDIIIKGLKK
ncbi:TetR/AcrR family transcriptional regulator [Ilyobacter sp.]|uniref:TetR/AcrR family transcriptional regulator n=1 Tax=Ilyobacter sp. TaxID=3100343 RepID=UPI003567E85B